MSLETRLNKLEEIIAPTDCTPRPFSNIERAARILWFLEHPALHSKPKGARLIDILSESMKRAGVALA